ncbi:MAG: S8 family serine peptidase [Promethearchaeota archaeon]
MKLKKRRFSVYIDARKPRARYFSPITEIKIPEELADLIEKVTFSPPFRFFQSPNPPSPAYHHLKVPDQIAELLKASECHNWGYTGRGVHVVMIDSGFYRHPYYSSRGYSIDVHSVVGGVDNDDVGHGTAIAANLFAVAPDVHLTMIKAFDEEWEICDLSTALFATAFVDAGSKVDILSCSWGIPEGCMLLAEDFIEYRPVLEAEIEALIDRNITVIFAAGNKEQIIQCIVGWPSTMPEVISVGGAYINNLENWEDSNNWEASSYASSGESVLYSDSSGPRKIPDVCGIVGQAPNGIFITLPTQPNCEADNSFAGADQTETDDGWIVGSGTSSAAPQVAGVAALMIERYRGDGVDFTPALIKHKLVNKARDITKGTSACGDIAIEGIDDATGHGLVDAEASVSGKICFIATAAYGSPLAPQVRFLRHIRDVRLRKRRIGALFIDAYEWIYYKFSPRVARTMQQNHLFRNFIKKLVVSPVVHFLMGVFKPFNKLRNK